VVKLAEVVQKVDIVITATGNKNVVSRYRVITKAVAVNTTRHI
jgi:S-adenosylhomocysteine hydrolase